MKRVATITAALVTTLVAFLALLLWVNSAEARAMKNLDPVLVLVVSKPVPEGTGGAALTDALIVKEMPRIAVVADAVSDPKALTGKVASTTLQVGEQVLLSRFVDPAVLGQQADVPKGFDTVSVLLGAERVNGGVLSAGDKVGVYASFGADDTSNTHLLLNKVQVVQVGGGVEKDVNPAGADAPAVPAAEADTPEESIMVTVTLLPKDVERLVYARENGRIWLSRASDDSNTTSTKMVTRTNVYA